MYPEHRLAHNWLIYRIGNNLVRRRLPLLHGDVLDIGCGERPFEADVLQHASTYTGCDWSNTLHALCADVVADANRTLPFRDAAFDHVMSLEVLEHLAEPDVMLCEAFRVLKPGGELTLSVPFQWWVHEAPYDYHRFTRHGLAYHLRKAGFIEVSITPRTGFWSMWFLKLNYQLKRLVRGPSAIRMVVTGLLIPVWWLDQIIGPWLDKVWPEDNEAQGYFVTARKAL